MPVHIRNFYYKQLIEAKKLEKEQVEKSKNSGGKSNRVRMNR
jgi:hypothetical protein